MKTIQEIELGKLIPTPENPRKIPKIPDANLKALAKSIKARGVLHPVIARLHPKKKGFYDLRAGARRHFAAEITGFKKIPVLVLELTDREAAEITVAENKDRQDLHPLEEAKAVSLLLSHSTLEDAAATYDKTIPWIKRRAKLLDLTPSWKKLALDDSEDNSFTRWSARHFEQIARFPGETQVVILKRLSRAGYNFPETYSDLKKVLADFIRLLAGAHWKFDDAELAPKAGPCNKCLKRSSIQPDLFDDLDPIAKKNQSDDRCLDAECWNKKYNIHLERSIEAARGKYGKNLVLIAHDYNEEQKFKNSVSHWNIDGVKKSAKGAVPAFNLKTMRVQWIKDIGTSPGHSPTKTEGPTPLKERREKLQKRREVLAVGGLIKILTAAIAGEATEMTLSMDDLLRGLACFGTEHNAAKSWATKGSKKSDWDNLQNVLTPEHAQKDLLSSLLGTFVCRLNPKAYDAPHTTEARHSAHYLDIDFEALLANATDKIKEPASWANLKADGTPKERQKVSRQPSAGEKGLAEAARGSLSKTTSKVKPAGKKPAKKAADKKPAKSSSTK